MRKLFSRKEIFGIALFVLTCSAANAGSPLQLNGDGLGTFKFGMSLKAVNAGLRVKIVPPEVSQRATANCYYSPVAELPGVGFVFFDDVLKRIDVATTDVQTAAHVSVGDSQNEAIGKIHAARTEPLAYIPEGFTLVQELTDSPNGISYQFNDHKVIKIISGDRMLIRFAEGCD